MTKTKQFPKKTIKDLPLDGKTVLMRADYNVPLTKDGDIADDYRITQSLPTIQYLLKQKCKIVICSHLGRPDGKASAALSLRPAADRLQQLLDHPVTFISASIGDMVGVQTKKMRSGQIIMLENLRFHDAEEANDAAFAQQLARDSHAQYLVQDAFGVVHRAHASTSAITHFLPSVAGFLLQKEFSVIAEAMHAPKRPLVAVLGGAKVSDKTKVIERFIDIADRIIIGGAMANNFLKHKGYNIGKSKHEDDLEGIIEKIYDKAAKKVGPKGSVDDFIILPSDVAVTTEIDAAQRRYTVDVNDVASDEYMLDIGPATIEIACEQLRQAGTVIWNGPLGLTEMPQYSYGSARVALQLAQQKDRTNTIIGGGDTADFILDWDGAKGNSFSHISTGGGASLELMAGDPMPGIDALLDA